MGRPKKIDYASMFSYDEKKELYYAVRVIDGKKRRFYARDPEELYQRVEAAENAIPKPLTFKEIAEEWKDRVEALEEDVVFLKSIVKSLVQQVSELKKAQ